MFCRHCGNEIEDNTKFCRFCGASTNVDGESAVKRKSTQSAMPESTANPRVKQTKAATHGKRNLTHIIYVLVAIIVILAVIFAVLMVNILGKSGENERSTEEPVEAIQNFKNEDLPSEIEYHFIDYTEFSQYWFDGVFRCGTDFNSGEYYILPLFGAGAMYDVSSSPNDWSWSDYRCFRKITAKEGDYVNVEHGAIMVPADEVDTDNWQKYGIYLVGRDILAGEYKMETITDTYSTDLYGIEGISGAYQICDNAIENTPIDSNYLFESQKYITLENGQYISITNIRLTNVDVQEQKPQMTVDGTEEAVLTEPEETVEPDYYWTDVLLHSELPEPQSNKGDVQGNYVDSLYMIVENTSFDDFKEYVVACTDMGYNLDVADSTGDYEAYSANGGALKLSYFEYDRAMHISLDMLVTETFRWQDIRFANLLPAPNSTRGKVQNNNNARCDFYVGNTSKDDFLAYVNSCKALGFTTEAMDLGNYYFAKNTDSYELTLEYYGCDVMYIELYDPNWENK